MSLAGKEAKLQATTETSQSFGANETLSDVGPSRAFGSGRLFYIDDSTKDIFDPQASFTVELDTGGGFASVSTSDFVVNYLIGAIDINNATLGDSCRITGGGWLTKYDILEGFSCDLSIGNSLEEIPQFQDEAQRRKNTINEFTSTFSSYRINEYNLDDPTNAEPTLRELLLGSTTESSPSSVDPHLVFSFNTDAGGGDLIRAWVLLSEESLSASADGIQELELSMSVDESHLQASMSSQTAETINVLKTQ